MLLHRLACAVFALIVLVLAGCGTSEPGADLGQRLSAAGHAVSPPVPGPAPVAAAAILPGPRAIPAGPASAPAPTITADQLFDWAQINLPQFFPSAEPSYDLAPYRFRYYPGTQLYLAVESGDQVLLLGAPTGWQILPVGRLADFAPLVSPPPGPAVSNVVPDQLMYLKTTFFTVTGTGLDAGVTATTRGCSGSPPVPTVTATGLLVACPVAAAGTDAVGLDLRSASGALLSSRSFTVPKPQVTMTTTLGTMVIELEPTAAPLSSNNFLRYVQAGFYDNTIFHRVVRLGIGIAQGGWLTPVPAVKAGAFPSIALESNRGLSNLRGTIAMARTAQPDTATSQFYFNVTDNTALDYASPASPGYAVFGRVVQGLPVVDALGALPTANRFGLADFPTSFVIVQSAVQTR